MRQIRCFDLFSGIGGFRQGVNTAAKPLNIKPNWVGRSDIDPYANKIYDCFYNTKKRTFTKRHNKPNRKLKPIFKQKQKSIRKNR